MVLKSSLLTLLIGSAFSTTALADTTGSYLIHPVENYQESNSAELAESVAEYRILLKQPGAIDTSYAKNGVNRKEAINQVSLQQQQLFADITTLDSSAYITDRIRLIANMLHVVMAKDTADKLAAHKHIHSIIATDGNIAAQSEMLAKGLQAKDENPYPLLKINDAKGAPVVAIIGSGVDYTHKSLGGNGDYGQAYDNMVNSWEGFPNDVVIGGFDFASESGTYDYNPLEYPNDFLTYVGGTGTMAASLIRQAAPDAKILAYKVEGIGFAGYHIGQNPNNILKALEMSIDPNLDGDLSDSADVVILDTAASSFGFYREFETGIDGNNVQVKMLRSLAAAGMQVVLPSGDASAFYEYHFDSDDNVIVDEEGLPKRFTVYHHSYFNVASRAIAPEAITVGTAYIENDQYHVDKATSIGPTRGDSVLKPDILSVNREVFGAIAASGSAQGRLATSNFLMAAKVAATATSIMQSHPELTPSEVKSLIVNTGNINTINEWGVAQIGGGTIQPLSANSSYALMIDNDNHQPSLNLGFLDVSGQRSVSRNIKIKNISDSEQLYHSEIIINGTKQSNDAISIDFPETIILAAGEEKIVAVTFRIDAAKLERDIITKGTDFTIDNWDRLAFQGYLQLNHSINSAANIRMPWLVMPQVSDDIEVDKDSFDFAFHYSEYVSKLRDIDYTPLPHSNVIEGALKYGANFEEHILDLVNNSDYPQTLYAMPIIYRADRKPLSLATNYGHIPQTIAGGVYPEASCESGQKLSMAVTMFDNIDVPVANHFERGLNLVAIKLYTMQAVEDANYDNYVLVNSSSPDHQLTELSTRLNSENSFSTHYIDLSMPFDRFRPTARIKRTSLPMIFSPNRKTVINSICTNDLYHGAINEQTLAEPLAMIVSTDRQAIPGPWDAPLMHNFTLGGLVTNKVNEDAIDPAELECGNNQIKDLNKNCINYYPEDVVDTYLYEYLEAFGMRKGDLAPVCYVNGNVNFECVVEHELFVEAIEFDSPLIANGELICDFQAKSVTANCIAEEIKNSTEIAENDKWQYEITVKLDTLLIPPVFDGSPGTSSFTGTMFKFAHINSAEQTTFDWQDSITLQPNTRVKTSTLFSSECAVVNVQIRKCSEGAAVFNPQTGYFAIAGSNSVLPVIKAGQSFSVAENAPIGETFGQVQLSGTTLIHGLITTEAEFSLIGDSAGAPFQLSSDGVLSIRDPSRIDYETQQHYPVLVSVKVGKSHGITVQIDVFITNSNDNAPQQVSAIEEFIAEQGLAIEPKDLSVYFTDVDGIGLKYKANDLPQGLILNSAGLLTGTPLVNGEFTAQITVNDGQNFYQADMVFNIAASSTDSGTDSTNENSSSGGTFYMSLLLVLFCCRRFR
ncbi:putative Ig domain-containing protein [Thalassotalea psychrophila]|uniref:Ig domain-containing protein n=1 Tax=Thalassotalea psychrophila TaxID=3065647 RepID=A0ABY9TYE2_9GAMM|nr:putative Ig domain-containing protein [Colwelliaceae bacterium SQ149]